MISKCMKIIMLGRNDAAGFPEVPSCDRIIQRSDSGDVVTVPMTCYIVPIVSHTFRQ